MANPAVPQTTYAVELSFDNGVSFYRTKFWINFQQPHAIWNIFPRVGVIGAGAFTLTLSGYFNFDTLWGTPESVDEASLKRAYAILPQMWSLKEVQFNKGTQVMFYHGLRQFTWGSTVRATTLEGNHVFDKIITDSWNQNRFVSSISIDRSANLLSI